MAIEIDIEGHAMEDFYGQIEEGEYFGEVGLREGTPKSMTAWCLKNTHCLTLNKKTYEKIRD